MDTTKYIYVQGGSIKNLSILAQVQTQDSTINANLYYLGVNAIDISDSTKKVAEQYSPGQLQMINTFTTNDVLNNFFKIEVLITDGLCDNNPDQLYGVRFKLSPIPEANVTGTSSCAPILNT